MKKLIFPLIICLFIASCKSKEEKAKNIVTDFLTAANDKTKQLDRSIITDEFSDLISNKKYYTSSNWKITPKPENDSIILVEVEGETRNGLGMPLKIAQAFGVRKEKEGWKIFNSYHFLSDNYKFTVVKPEWDFYWDKEKTEICNIIKDNLVLQHVGRPSFSYFGDALEGKLRVTNNSEYDVKGIDVLIEHYDRNGQSVNTDHASVYDIVRSHGYRDFEWYTSDCGNCATTDVKLQLEAEN